MTKLLLHGLEAKDKLSFAEDDQLNLEKFGAQLSRIFSGSEIPLVVALDAPWGQGKTTFLKMWRAKLEAEDAKIIHFDAFAHDYAEDPFTPLVAALSNSLKASGDSEGSETMISKASAVAVRLLPAAARVSVRALATLALGPNGAAAAQELKSGVVDEMGKFTESVLTDYIKDQADLDDHLAAFQETLTALADSRSNKDLPLIVIIDELDRCKPSFAVALLERIKHFLAVPNVAFLLSCHFAQLEIAIGHVYGEIEAQAYLGKFIHLRCSLPTYSESPRWREARSSYAADLIRNHEFSSHLGPNLSNTLPELSEHFRLSLRNLERVCTTLALYDLSTDERCYSLSWILVPLAILRATDFQLYQDVRDDQCDYKSLMERSPALTKATATERDSQRMLPLRLCLSPNHAISTSGLKGQLESFMSSVGAYGFESRKEIIPDMCRHFDMLLD